MTRRAHHGRQVDRTPDGKAACFSGCGKAAGNPTHPLSAYCESDQPTREPIIGGSFGCSLCHRQFGRLADWSRHMLVDLSTPVATITCLDPAALDGEPLQLDARGVWLTASGLSKRERIAGMRRWPDRA